MLSDVESAAPADDGDGPGVTRPHSRFRERLSAAKKPFVCRRVDFGRAVGLDVCAQPQPGDLVLAQVDELGLHVKLESPLGRRVQLYRGDEVVLVYGARYAPDQFEAVVPTDSGPCDMVAAGGIAARVVSRHESTKRATAITPVGLLSDANGRILNLRQFALPPAPANGIARTIVCVVGTSMNSGKTTAAAHLVRGLARGGVRTACCKLTGTGSGGDLWSMLDAGAVRALDFTDAGFATTANVEAASIQRLAHDLISHAECGDVDVVVVEIADGLLQRETAALLGDGAFSARLDAIMLAAADAMGAVAGYEWLRKRNLPVRAVTGLVTASPLAAQEVRRSLDVEVLAATRLSESAVAARVAHAVATMAPRSVAT